MNILVIMIPLSILLLIGAGVAFFWAVEHDQFDDLDTPKLLPLLDDPAPKTPAPGADGSKDAPE
jgi:cbb3-type cytochrome oxidase maturation protein